MPRTKSTSSGDGPHNLSMEGLRTTLVVMPDGRRLSMAIEAKKPLIDFQVLLCARAKLSPTTYILQAFDEESGRPRDFKSSMTIGKLLDMWEKPLYFQLSLRRTEIQQLQEKWHKAAHDVTKPFEVTQRLVVHLENSQRALIRVAPSQRLADIVLQVCKQRNMSPLHWHVQTLRGITPNDQMTFQDVGAPAEVKLSQDLGQPRAVEAHVVKLMQSEQRVTPIRMKLPSVELVDDASRRRDSIDSSLPVARVRKKKMAPRPPSKCEVLSPPSQSIKAEVVAPVRHHRRACASLERDSDSSGFHESTSRGASLTASPNGDVQEKISAQKPHRSKKKKAAPPPPPPPPTPPSALVSKILHTPTSVNTETNSEPFSLEASPCSADYIDASPSPPSSRDRQFHTGGEDVYSPYSEAFQNCNGVDEIPRELSTYGNYATSDDQESPRSQDSSTNNLPSTEEVYSRDKPLRENEVEVNTNVRNIAETSIMSSSVVDHENSRLERVQRLLEEEEIVKRRLAQERQWRKEMEEAQRDANLSLDQLGSENGSVDVNGFGEDNGSISDERVHQVLSTRSKFSDIDERVSSQSPHLYATDDRITYEGMMRDEEESREEVRLVNVVELKEESLLLEEGKMIEEVRTMEEERLFNLELGSKEEDDRNLFDVEKFNYEKCQAEQECRSEDRVHENIGELEDERRTAAMNYARSMETARHSVNVVTQPEEFLCSVEELENIGFMSLSTAPKASKTSFPADPFPEYDEVDLSESFAKSNVYAPRQVELQEDSDFSDVPACVSTLSVSLTRSVSFPDSKRIVVQDPSLHEDDIHVTDLRPLLKPVCGALRRPGRETRRVVEPTLSPREELMIEVRSIGGSLGLRQVPLEEKQYRDEAYVNVSPSLHITRTAADVTSCMPRQTLEVTNQDTSFASHDYLLQAVCSFDKKSLRSVEPDHYDL